VRRALVGGVPGDLDFIIVEHPVADVVSGWPLEIRASRFDARPSRRPTEKCTHTFVRRVAGALAAVHGSVDYLLYVIRRDLADILAAERVGNPVQFNLDVGRCALSDRGKVQRSIKFGVGSYPRGGDLARPLAAISAPRRSPESRCRNWWAGSACP
jgi:hypothetical protein